MTDDTRADRDRRAGRRVGRLGWLLAAIALAVAAGLVLDQSGVAEEVAQLGEAERWATHYDPDSATAVAVAPKGGVWAGTNAAGLVRWHADGSYRRYLPEELAGQPVRNVAVGDDGTVWAAVSPWDSESSDRLVRFDGDEWRAEPVPHGESETARVRSLAAGDGGVWVATGQGLARFDGHEWARPYTRDDGSPVRADSVVVDDDGVVWAAVYDEHRRVIRFDDTRGAMVWPTEGELAYNPPLAGDAPLAVGADGSVWLTTVEHFQDGETRVQPWRFSDDERVAAAPAFDGPGGHIQAFAVDHEGRPWIAAAPQPNSQRDDPLWHYDGRQWQRYGRADGFPHTLVGSLTVDDNGVVWAATVDGVARFADGEWTRLATGEGPASDFTADLATGEEAGVWAAGGLGVSHFDGRRWTTWGADDGLGAELAHRVAVGPDGVAWAATRDGVVRFDGEEWTGLPAASGLGDDGVQSLAAGPDGVVWVGAHGRVARFDGAQWTTWTDVDGLAGGQVRSLAVGEGTVWAATPDGVARFDGDGWQRFTDEDGLPTSSVTAVALGTGPRVWAGTEQGLARFDGQRWAHADSADAPVGFDGDPPVARGPVAALATAEDGTVWAATDEALSAFDGWEWHTTPLEVAVPNVHALAVDEAAAWLAGPSGLARFDRQGQ